MPREEQRRRLDHFQQAQARLELLAAVAQEARPVRGAGDDRLELREHLAAVAHAERERVARARRTPRTLAQRAALEDRGRPAAAGAEHVAVAEAAAGGEAAKSSSATRPAIRSLMCTSNASKPARSNAAAISIWPLTPCSRRIATFGRTPRGDERRGDVLGRIEGQERLQARRVEVARAAARSSSAHSGLSRSFCIAWRHRPPGVEQLVPAPLGQRSCLPRARGSPAPWSAGRCAARSRSGRGARPGRRSRRGPRSATCTTAPSSSLNRVRNGSSPQPSRLMSRPSARAERHLAQRRERAAVGTVVVGAQQAGFARVADQFEEIAQALRVVEVGHAGAASRQRIRAGRDGTAPGPSRPGAACRRPGRSATARCPRRATAAASAARARRRPARTR